MLKKIKILNNSLIHVTCERDDDNEWSAESTYTDNNIVGFNIVDDQDYFDFITDICTIPGRSYTLIYVLYGTGDSFSHHGGQIDYIGLYDTIDSATAIHENYNKLMNATGNSVTLTAENGEEYTYGVPWNGYFEHLEGIEMMELYESIKT